MTGLKKVHFNGVNLAKVSARPRIDVARAQAHILKDGYTNSGTPSAPVYLTLAGNVPSPVAKHESVRWQCTSSDDSQAAGRAFADSILSGPLNLFVESLASRLSLHAILTQDPLTAWVQGPESIIGARALRGISEFDPLSQWLSSARHILGVTPNRDLWHSQLAAHQGHGHASPAHRNVVDQTSTTLNYAIGIHDGISSMPAPAAMSQAHANPLKASIARLVGASYTHYSLAEEVHDLAVIGKSNPHTLQHIIYATMRRGIVGMAEDFMAHLDSSWRSAVGPMHFQSLTQASTRHLMSAIDDNNLDEDTYLDLAYAALHYGWFSAAETILSQSGTGFHPTAYAIIHLAHIHNAGRLYGNAAKQRVQRDFIELAKPFTREEVIAGGIPAEHIPDDMREPPNTAQHLLEHVTGIRRDIEYIITNVVTDPQEQAAYRTLLGEMQGILDYAAQLNG